MIDVKGYKKEELEFIKKNFYSMRIKDIAEELNKSSQSVGYAARKMGLRKQIHNPWTDEEIQFIKDNYIEMTSEEISKKLGRTIASINTERDRLGLVRNAAWSDKDTEFLKENYDKLTHEEIGKILNRTTGAITAKCFDLDLYKKEIPWEQWEEDFLKNNYMEMTKAEISEVLNRSFDAIQTRAGRLGLKKYPYHCDYHYFENIENEEKAYWLGFLTADGWINRNEKTNSGVVGVELQYGDFNHLKKLNKSLKGNYKIADRWRKCSLSKYDKKNHSAILRFFSIAMYNSLLKIGFTNNKSFDSKIPKLKDDLYRHFIRGYFDGNGCICVSRENLSITICTASEKLKDNLISLLKSKNITLRESSYISIYGTKIYNLFISNNSEKYKFLNYIYKDATIYLDRKYEKYTQIMHKSLAS